MVQLIFADIMFLFLLWEMLPILRTLCKHLCFSLPKIFLNVLKALAIFCVDLHRWCS